MLKINETPVRTSRNFKINNIEIDEKIIPGNIDEFENVNIENESKNIKIDTNNNSNINLTYGLGEVLLNQVRNKANKKLKIEIDENNDKDVNIYFNFDKDNINLIDDIEILAKENSKANIIIKYEKQKNIKAYHNGIIRLTSNKQSNISLTIVNLLDEESTNFLTIENEIKENANVNLLIIDLGGNKSITNYYSNQIGDKSKNNIKAIYLGKNEDLIDSNYIMELRGKKSDVNLEVQGALKDNAKKNFKGTIDFKTGCVKAVGCEEESCMLLSDKAKALALPMLLCSEEDVEGSHSTSAGKIDEKQLFYIMSRGFSLKESQKLIVRAKFNNILENINDEKLKEKILNTIDDRLE